MTITHIGIDRELTEGSLSKELANVIKLLRAANVVIVSLQTIADIGKFPSDNHKSVLLLLSSIQSSWSKFAIMQKDSHGQGFQTSFWNSQQDNLVKKLKAIHQSIACNP